MGVRARFLEKQITLTYPTQKWASIIMFYQSAPLGALFFLKKTRLEVGFDYPAWPASLV